MSKKNVINIYQQLNEKVYKLHIIKTTGEEIDTYISTEDYDFISKYHWTFKLDKSKDKIYDYRVRATTGPFTGKDLSTALFNNDISTGLFVDHINRNTLDNTRDNLRLVSRSINATNAQPRIENKSGIRGVYYRKERPGIAKASWICEWSINKRRYSKSFSIEKYGENAYKLACDYRRKKLEEMKIQSSP